MAPTSSTERLELLGPRRVGVDVPLAVANDAELQRGVELRLRPGADDQLGRAAADVDDEGLAVAAAGR